MLVFFLFFNSLIRIFFYLLVLEIVRIHRALEAQARLGGEGLIPFYGLLDGGRDGELFKELEDYFYYAQIRRY